MFGFSRAQAIAFVVMVVLIATCVFAGRAGVIPGVALAVLVSIAPIFLLLVSYPESPSAAEASAASRSSDAYRAQKFFGRPSLRREMMFFWISEPPPPTVSMTV